MERNKTIPISEIESVLRRRRSYTERLLAEDQKEFNTPDFEARQKTRQHEIDCIAQTIETDFNVRLNIGREGDIPIPSTTTRQTPNQ